MVSRVLMYNNSKALKRGIQSFFLSFSTRDTLDAVTAATDDEPSSLILSVSFSAHHGIMDYVQYVFSNFEE